MKTSTLIGIAIALWAVHKTKTAQAQPAATRAPGQPPLPTPPTPRGGPAPAKKNGRQPPPGYLGKTTSAGLHDEPGTLYWYPNKDEYFIPNDPSLAPYRVPGGTRDLPHP